MRATAIIAMLIAACLATATPAAAQDSGGNAGASQSNGKTSEEILVQGLPEGDPPVEQRPTTANRARAERQVAGDSHRFVRCMRNADPEILRRMLAAEPEARARAIELDRLIRRNTGCFSGLPMLLPMAPPPYYGQCNPILFGDMPGETVCHSFYDFGALVEYVLERYADDLDLTAVITRNRVIAERFMRRETARNEHRTSNGRNFFEITSCIVQLHPERALGLVRSEPGSNAEERLRGFLLGYSEPCLGDVEEIRVDPAQFRVYIAEAVYEWALAARDVESLIPADAD